MNITHDYQHNQNVDRLVINFTHHAHLKVILEKINKTNVISVDYEWETLVQERVKKHFKNVDFTNTALVDSQHILQLLADLTELLRLANNGVPAMWRYFDKALRDVQRGSFIVQPLKDLVERLINWIKKDAVVVSNTLSDPEQALKDFFKNQPVDNIKMKDEFMFQPRRFKLPDSRFTYAVEEGVLVTGEPLNKITKLLANVLPVDNVSLHSRNSTMVLRFSLFCDTDFIVSERVTHLLENRLINLFNCDTFNLEIKSSGRTYCGDVQIIFSAEAFENLTWSLDISKIPNTHPSTHTFLIDFENAEQAAKLFSPEYPMTSFVSFLEMFSADMEVKPVLKSCNFLKLWVGDAVSIQQNKSNLFEADSIKTLFLKQMSELSNIEYAEISKEVREFLEQETYRRLTEK